MSDTTGTEQQPSHNNIREIVHMVKNGKIDKAEALNELRSILNSSTSKPESFPDIPVSTDDEATDAVEASAHDADVLSAYVPFSQEDRRLLINKLIERKKLSREGKGTENPAIEPENSLINGYPDDSDLTNDALRTGRDESMSSIQGSSRWDTRHAHENNDASSHDHYIREDRSVSVGSQRGADRYVVDSWAAYKQREEEGDGAYSVVRGKYDLYPSVDDSLLGDTRPYRASRTEATIRSEMMREFTFRPKIKHLPATYGRMKDKDTPFYARVMKWQQEKQTHHNSLKQDFDKSVDLECTFHPNINQNSERAIAYMRGGDTDSSHAHFRLYKSNEAALVAKSRIIEQELEKAKKEDSRECTFHPNMLTDQSRFSDVAPRYLKTQKKAVENPVDKECTFTPKVKGVTPGMRAAKMYVDTNLVDRLTKPAPPNPSSTAGAEGFDVTYGGDRSVIDMSAFLGSVQGKGAGNKQQRPGSAPSGGRSQAVMGQQRLQQFLGRVEQGKLRKERHIEELERTVAPTFKPQLCKGTNEIATTHVNGDVMDRMERSVLRRIDADQRRAMAYASSMDGTVVDVSECTFKPSITKKSENLRSRSVFELSRGDFLRKDAAQRILKLRREEEEQQVFTFQPEITRRGEKASSGALKLLQDPAMHLQWEKERIKKRQEDQRLEQQQREEREAAECTFKPSVNDCPDYVKRIAKSMAAIRSARARAQDESSGGTEKPQWRFM